MAKRRRARRATKKASRSRKPARPSGHFDVLSLGLSLGLVWGGSMAFTALLVMFGWGNGFTELIAQWYIGFGATPVGALLGFVYGFIDGFIGGVVIAWLYNKFHDMRS